MRVVKPDEEQPSQQRAYLFWWQQEHKSNLRDGLIVCRDVATVKLSFLLFLLTHSFIPPPSLPPAPLSSSPLLALRPFPVPRQIHESQPPSRHPQPQRGWRVRERVAAREGARKGMSVAAREGAGKRAMVEDTGGKVATGLLTRHEGEREDANIEAARAARRAARRVQQTLKF
eukprot:766400-Hanusia_phi.AAC.6